MVLALILAIPALTLAQSTPSKKNSRPADKPAAAKTLEKPFVPVYTYVFENPKFVVSRVEIAHDESGSGTVSFTKRDFDEEITEPLKISETTLEHLKSLWEELDFLDSQESLQSPERDYGHLGTMTLVTMKDGKRRESVFNWTENKQAKELTDEYKKIGNQFIWIFDMDVARRNQPLETPRIMKGLDTNLRRGAIADPQQMLPYLKELKNDERLPLIARNHAERIIKQIESKKKD